MNSVHSVSALDRLKTELRSLGVRLLIDADGRLQYDSPVGLTDDLLAKLKANRDGLLAAIRMTDEAIVEIWEERSAVQQTDNMDLIRWHYDTKPTVCLRRICELNAAADLALLLGDYVLTIIRPLVAKD